MPRKRSEHQVDIDTLEYEADSIVFIKTSIPKYIIYLVMAIFSLGLYPLILSWTKIAKHWAIFTKTQSDKASYVLITTPDGVVILCKLQSTQIKEEIQKYIDFRFIKYFLNNETQTFKKFNFFKDKNLRTIKEQTPLTKDIELERRIQVGMNTLKTPVTPLLTVLTAEILGPFNVYQFIACIIWCFRDYMSYSVMIMILMFFAISFELYENRIAQRRLRQKSEILGDLEFKKKGENGEIYFQKEHNNIAVPGDTIKISPGMIAPCDIIIVFGECLVDESVLTGESVPIYKTEIPSINETFQNPKHDKHVIFCGSKILKSYTLLDSEIEADGIVFQTGFNTLKGQVTRNILYPKNVMFKHEKESYKYLFSLFGFSITMLITYYIYAFLINRPSSSTFYIVLAGADIIFTAFPPGLPLCLIVGISFATKRLKEMKVDCLKPSLINAAGRIKTFCFDKTGTLTKTSMNFTGLSILDSSKNYFSLISLDNELEFVNLDEEIDNPGLQKCPRDIFYGMGTCHTINIVKNEVLGDSMELEIFKFSQGFFKDQNDSKIYNNFLMNGDFYKKEKIFEFNSIDQRMSVIVKKDSGNGIYEIYCKGNPEKLKELCKKETLPINYDSHLEFLSKMGYRVLAIASRQSNTSDITRIDAEKDLQFLGLIVLENKLKEKTKEIIQKLNRADILSVMITGDNINTACAIALDCCILDNRREIFEVELENSEICKRPCKKLQAAYDQEEDKHSVNSIKKSHIKSYLDDKNQKPVLVIQGKTFQEIFEKYSKSLNPKKAIKSKEFKDILRDCRVYARTTPEQKQQIVSLLKLLKEEEDTLVGFCGDGANDTLALKEADIGLSLSLDDASLAAPFVSIDTELTSVENLIIEGRGAIACSFQNFKFFLFISLAQCFGVVILFFLQVDFDNFAYIWMDIVISIPCTILLGNLKSKRTISKKLPHNSLFTYETLLSFFVHLAYVFGLIILSCFAVRMLPDYKSPQQIKDEHSNDLENGILFTDLPYFESTVFLVSDLFRSFLCLQLRFAQRLVSVIQ